MTASRLVSLIAYVIIITGIIVITGWILDIPLFVNINPKFVNMKFDAALKFVLAGILILLLNKQQKGDCVLKGYTFAIILLSSTIAFLTLVVLLANIFGLPLEPQAGFASSSASSSIAPSFSTIILSIINPPPIPGLISFFLMALAGFLQIFGVSRKHFIWIGSIISIFGLVALAGYLLGNPALYYYIEGISTGMAFHGAILFFLTGLSLFLLGRYAPRKQMLSKISLTQHAIFHDNLLKLQLIISIVFLISLVLFAIVYVKYPQAVATTYDEIITNHEKIKEEHRAVEATLKKIIENDAEIVKRNQELMNKLQEQMQK